VKPLKLSLRGPHGYHEESGPGLLGQWGSFQQENDTYTCQHCGGITIVRRDTPQAWCKRCMGMVCERCAPRGACHPEDNPNREEWLEAAENRHRLRKIIDQGHT
jgi:hypothetical protein